MSHTASASAAGVLSETRLRLLVSGHAADPELHDGDTDRVFNEILDDRELAIATRQWIDAAKDHDDEPPRSHEFGLWSSETLDGTWRLDGTLAQRHRRIVDTERRRVAISFTKAQVKEAPDYDQLRRGQPDYYEKLADFSIARF